MKARCLIFLLLLLSSVPVSQLPAKEKEVDPNSLMGVTTKAEAGDSQLQAHNEEISPSEGIAATEDKEIISAENEAAHPFFIAAYTEEDVESVDRKAGTVTMKNGAMFAPQQGWYSIPVNGSRWRCHISNHEKLIKLVADPDENPGHWWRRTHGLSRLTPTGSLIGLPSYLQSSDPIEETLKLSGYLGGQEVHIDRAIAAASALLQQGDWRAAPLFMALATPLFGGNGFAVRNEDRLPVKNEDRLRLKTIFETCRKYYEDGRHDSEKAGCWLMGEFYNLGIGTPPQPRKAITWFLKYAADGRGLTGYEKQFREDVAGNLQSASQPLYLHPERKGDLQLAFKGLSRSFELGNADVASHLGSMCADGKGCERNPRKAFNYYLMAAKRGDGGAQMGLTTLYWEGKGVPRDHVKALMWEYIACASEPKGCGGILDEIEHSLLPQQIAEAQRLARSFRVEPHASVSSDNQEGEERRGTVATGTGFLVTDDGYLLTNFHVVQGAKRITVILPEGSQEAKLVASDQQNDLAVLKISGSFLPMPLGDTREVSLGDSVFTIGFPNIDVQGTEPKLTRGEISALSGIGDDHRLFQISVPIQPGNSGGPLVNERGNVVGITAAQLDALKMAHAQHSIPQNVNYAIKIGYARLLLEGIPDAEAKLIKTHEAPISPKECIGATKRATVLVLSSN